MTYANHKNLRKRESIKKKVKISPQILPSKILLFALSNHQIAIYIIYMHVYVCVCVCVCVYVREREEGGERVLEWKHRR